MVDHKWLKRFAVVLVGVSAVLCMTSAFAQDEDPADFLEHARFDSTQEYYLYAPTSGVCSGPCPLFIFIHGSMSSGTGDFVMWKNYADKEGFILLAPHFEGYYDLQERGEDERLIKIVDEVHRHNPIDRKRVLLCGFSRGAMFAYRFAMRHPSFAHTVAVLNGGDFPSPVAASSSQSARFYIATGSVDPLFAGQHEPNVRALRDAGYQVIAHEAKGVGHSIPTASVTHILKFFSAMRDGEPFELSTGSVGRASAPRVSPLDTLSGPSVTLHLKVGGRVNGRLVEDSPDAVVIGWPSGSATFKREIIDHIEKHE